MSEEEDPFLAMGPNELKVYIEQLRRESGIARCKTSEGCKAVMEYIVENLSVDPLIIGIDSKTNPYIEKKDCVIF